MRRIAGSFAPCWVEKSPRRPAAFADRRPACAPRSLAATLFFLSTLHFQPHPPMILWQKQASAEWLAAHELRLDEIGSCDLAVISRPARVRSLIQVTCRSRIKAEKLVREFGGAARLLSRNWSEIAQTQKARAP